LKEKSGTWTTAEIQKAVILGYTIESVDAILHFEGVSATLFRKYISVFFRLKIIATGWKKLGMLEVDQQKKYLDEVEHYFDIHIEIGDVPMEHNPGLYWLSKLCLNSLWGKFAQRDQYSNTVDVFSEAEFFKIVDDDRNEITNVYLYDTIVRGITFRSKREFIRPSSNTNLAIAAYTTAYGRLKLYELLELYKERILYFDTDSAVVVCDEMNRPRVGVHMGEISSELEKDEWIVEWLSTGPKSYFYRTNKGKTVIKIKGFTLDVDARKDVNEESIRSLIYGTRECIKTKPMQFMIDREHVIRTKSWEEDGGKKLRFTDTKRRHIHLENGTIDSVPWKDEGIEDTVGDTVCDMSECSP
jgi:hypothetical protein